MANYYEVLKVSPDASRADIRSAYRRLARKLHPDKNNGSGETARSFAAIAEAYEILGNPKERVAYDKLILKARYQYTRNGDSVFVSANTHARRWRQLVYEHRYNEIIDRMIADERRESMELQRVIFPTVALFVSFLVVAIIKPQVFEVSAVIGKIIVVSLFMVGVIHLYGRIRDGLQRFAYDDSELHESILDERERKIKPFSRLFAGAFLLVGVALSFGIGLLIGTYADIFPVEMPLIFSHQLKPEFIFYPPIFVLVVDLMHAFALRADI